MVEEQRTCESELARIARMRVSEEGKFRVLGIDKFSDENWIHGEYNTAEEALSEARRLTKEAMPSATDSSIATVYYAYNPKGKYLGGDVYNGD